MSCDKCLELLSARLDGALTEKEERELEEHLTVCPDCRAAGAQPAALQAGFNELEDVPAPEGFAEGVMERIRAAEAKKVIPLFRRPRFKALAGLAACAVLAVGLYGAAQNQKLEMRSFNRNAVVEMDAVSEIGDIEAPEATSFCLGGDQEEDLADVPFNAQKAVVGDRAMGTAAEDMEPDFAEPGERFSDSAVLILGRLPEGAEDLIPPETVVSYNPATGEEGYRWTTDGEPEALARLEHLAQEQEISAERSSLPAEELLYDVVVLSD